MIKNILTAVLLLAVSLLSFAQTSDEVVLLLNDIEERVTKFGYQVFSIEEFNFGIPGGKNWLIEWEGSRGQIYPFIYVVDVVSREIKFCEQMGLSEKGDVHPLAPHFESLPGRTVGRWVFQVGDFNGEGFDMMLDFNIGTGGPSVYISGYDPQTGEIRNYFGGTFDSKYDKGPPVRFIEYKGMQGFMLLRGTGYVVPGGEGWVPDPTPSWAGKWFFYTWDKEQRKFVEIEEVNEDGTEIERPVSDPVVTAEAAPVSEALPAAVPAHETANAETSPMPLWAWFAIIGGAVVVVGGVVVFVAKRKK
ncbi:MAG: hypothetical protein LBH44_14770 [Treponema sp.]|jgi:hypothetical protein|nr:hypothetical protein [Treponema sp.]